MDKVSPVLQNALKIVQHIPGNVALVDIRHDPNISERIGKEISQPHSAAPVVPPGSIRMPGEAGNSHNASLSHKIVIYLSKPEEKKQENTHSAMISPSGQFSRESNNQLSNPLGRCLGAPD